MTMRDYFDVDQVSSRYSDLRSRYLDALKILGAGNVIKSDAVLAINDETLSFEWLGHKFRTEVKPVRAARDDKVDSLDLAMEVRFVLPASPETVPAIEACRVYYYDATWRSTITEPEGEASGFWSIDAGNRYAAKELRAFLCRKIYRSSILGKTPR